MKGKTHERDEVLPSSIRGDAVVYTDIRTNYYLKTLFILLAAAVFVQRLLVLSVPMIEMGGMEINVLYGMLRILQGEPLYQNAAVFPFSAMQYPPLHYFIVAKAVAFLYKTPTLATLYVWNRAFSLVWNVLLGVLIFFVLQKEKLPKIDAAFWASIVFVAATMPFYNRMDALYWLLFVVFMTINKVFLVKKSDKNLFFSAIIAALLCLTKQTAYGLVALHFLFFIKTIGWRKTAIWAFVVAFFYAIGFFMMVENLHFFYQNTVLGLVCKLYFWEVILQFFTNKHFLVLLPLCGAAVFFVYQNWRLRNYYEVLLLVYTLFFALFGIFKEASDVHYFAETTILVCLDVAGLHTKSFLRTFLRTEETEVCTEGHGDFWDAWRFLRTFLHTEEKEVFTEEHRVFWSARRFTEGHEVLKIALFCCILPLFFVKTTSVFYKIHGSHFIHNEADLLENEKSAAEYLKSRLNDSVFAHVFYTSTIPAHLQQHVITPQPDVFSAVSDQNVDILNAKTAFLHYNKPDFCVIRNDETIQSIHNRLRIAFPQNYRRDTVFGRVEVWKASPSPSR